MQVDRTKFLHLVTAIAATTVACGTKPEPQSAIMVPVEAPPDAGTPLANGPATGPANATSPAPTRAPMPPPEEAEPAAAPLASGAGGIWKLSYDPNAKPHTCADLKCPGPTQETMGVLRNTCRTIEKRLSTETFQRFMTCMKSYNNTSDTCDLRKVSESHGDCLEGWYETPAINPGATAKCKPIVTTCNGPNRSVHAGKGITMDECQKVLSVTNAKSEAKMIHCVTEYCGEALRLCHGGYG